MGPLGPFGTLGPYLFSYFGPLWALLGPLDPIMSDFYETLLFLERQEAFWKDQNDSGKTRMILERPEWFWKVTRPVMGPGPGPWAQGGRRPTFGPFYSGPGSKNMQK